MSRLTYKKPDGTWGMTNGFNMSEVPGKIYGALWKLKEYEDRNRVNKKITDILGGYESNAYNDKHLRGKVYSRFNKDYCDYFRINARANTLASKFEGALSYIDMWIPDTNLQLQIKYCNAQLSMEV